MSSETRQNPRYALDAAVEISRDGGVLRGRCKNVSSGGLCAELTAGIPVGEQCTLKLSLVFDEDTFSEPLALPARSVWCTELSGTHQLGFQFVALTGEQTSFLGMFIRYLEEGRAALEPADNSSDPDVFS